MTELIARHKREGNLSNREARLEALATLKEIKCEVKDATDPVVVLRGYGLSIEFLPDVV